MQILINVAEERKCCCENENANSSHGRQKQDQQLLLAADSSTHVQLRKRIRGDLQRLNKRTTQDSMLTAAPAYSRGGWYRSFIRCSPFFSATPNNPPFTLSVGAGR